MSTATTAAEREAQAAAVAFHLALTQIGVVTLDEALDLWTDVSSTPSQVAPTAGRWLARAINLVSTRRSMSRDLAMSYYRLVRALRTGTTVADWRKPEPEYVTMGDLRREFRLLVEEQGIPAASSEQAQATLARNMPEGELPEPLTDDEEDDDAQVLIEDIEALEAEERANELADEEELSNALSTLGAKLLSKRLREAEAQAEADADALREEAHRKLGARTASITEMSVLNGGRSKLWSLGRADGKAIGYVRVSRTGTPCGWCAMLISRKVLYKSKASATSTTGEAANYGDGDEYHPNCHCYAEPVFSASQFENDPRFDLNRRYAAEWKSVIKDKNLGGTTALTVWRKHIRDSERERAAQVAA